MTTLLVLLLSLGLLCSTQSTSYNCLTISGVGCVCGQGYVNDNGVCKQLMPTIACADGFVWNGTACTSQRTITCPTGQIFNGSVCISLTSVKTSNSPCNSNQLYINGRCIPPSGNGACPFNTIWNGSQCVTDPNPKPIIVSIPTVSSNLNFVQTPSYQPLQIVCQTGYYYNCRTCVPVNGRPVCAGACEWNGQQCIDQTTTSTSNQQSPSFNRFYQGVQAYESEDQSHRRGSRNQGFNSNNRYQSRQPIVCPNNHCYDGNTCIPFSGKLNTVNCPTGYSQRNASNQKNSIQTILNQLSTNAQIIYATPQSNLQSYASQNQYQYSQPTTGFTISSSNVIPASCQQGQYWNGRACTRN